MNTRLQATRNLPPALMDHGYTEGGNVKLGCMRLSTEHCGMAAEDLQHHSAFTVDTDLVPCEPSTNCVGSNHSA